jgi:hypothetical protein
MSFGEENCENCNMKKKHISKGVVVNLILSKEFQCYLETGGVQGFHGH